MGRQGRTVLAPGATGFLGGTPARPARVRAMVRDLNSVPILHGNLLTTGDHDVGQLRK